jgi:hypothetical protein
MLNISKVHKWMGKCFI